MGFFFRRTSICIIVPQGDYSLWVLKFDTCISADLHKNAKFNTCKNLAQTLMNIMITSALHTQVCPVKCTES